MKAKVNFKKAIPITVVLAIVAVIIIHTFTGAATNTGGTRLVNNCAGSILNEYYCDAGNPMHKQTSCPNGCEDGACKQEAQTCTDSDGGKNYNLFGNINGYNTTTQQKYSISDTCSGNYIIEGFCSNNYPYQGWYECPNGCLNGACIETPSVTCTDSDGGVDYTKLGTCTDSAGAHTDFCSSGYNAVKDYYCAANNMCALTSYHYCTCANGACAADAVTCTDSDSGINYNKLGTCTDSAGAHTDFCSSGYNAVKDYYCSANKCILTNYYYCTCSGGACV